MNFVVEACYINEKPRLRILDACSRRVLLQWELHQVTDMFESGEIREEEFLQPEKYGMSLLVKNLFLIACIHDLKQERGQTNQQRPNLN